MLCNFCLKAQRLKVGGCIQFVVSLHLEGQPTGVKWVVWLSRQSEEVTMYIHIHSNGYYNPSVVTPTGLIDPLLQSRHLGVHACQSKLWITLRSMSCVCLEFLFLLCCQSTNVSRDHVHTPLHSCSMGRCKGIRKILVCLSNGKFLLPFSSGMQTKFCTHRLVARMLGGVHHVQLK